MSDLCMNCRINAGKVSFLLSLLKYNFPIEQSWNSTMIARTADIAMSGIDRHIAHFNAFRYRGWFCVMSLIALLQICEGRLSNLRADVSSGISQESLDSVTFES